MRLLPLMHQDANPGTVFFTVPGQYATPTTQRNPSAEVGEGAHSEACCNWIAACSRRSSIARVLLAKKCGTRPTLAR